MREDILNLIKKLRADMGAGFADCKVAAEESNGNYDKAVEILKAKGIAKAAKKMNNSAENGSIAVKYNENKLVLLNLRSETDFASSCDAFCDFINKEAEILLNSNEINIENTVDCYAKFNSRLSLFASTLGENVILNNQVVLCNSNETKYVPYLYKLINKKYNNITNLVSIVEVNKGANEELAKKLASHIIASNTMVINKQDITEEMRKEEEDIDSYVLMDQPYFHDSNLKVSEFLLNNNIQIKSFLIYKA